MRSSDQFPFLWFTKCNLGHRQCSGINGYLAPANPPTPGGLADAIIACVKDPETYARLCDGAGRVAAEFVLDDHMEALIRVLEDAAAGLAGDGTLEKTQ